MAKGQPAIQHLFKLWKASPEHWRLMMSPSYNYIGVGLAYRSSNHQTFGSLVFTESPDLTDARASMDGVTSNGNGATWSWHGWDPMLQTHLSGLQVVRRPGTDRCGPLADRGLQDDGHLARMGRAVQRSHLRHARARPGPGRQRRAMVANWRCGSPDPVRTGRFVAVNLISDPIHGYIELTKRLTSAESADAGLPDEDVAEQDLLDTAWVQRLRRISQLQSARWVFPTAEHSRFTHGLGVMHEAGMWARSLYPSLRASSPRPANRARPRAWSSRRCASPASSTTWATDRSRTSSTTTSCPRSRRPPIRAGRPAKRLTHEDLSGRIIEDELGPLIRGLRRAPGAVPERDAFAADEAIDPAWVAFLISKPALVDAAMPHWVRWLQPLLSGVFTVDNLDYVRRDAYLTGVSVGPSTSSGCGGTRFISSRGLTLYEPGLGALEIFLTARRFMYQQVYFHRTVRAIDLDLAAVFGPSIRAIFGDGVTGRSTCRLRRPRRIRAAPPGRPVGARRVDRRPAASRGRDGHPGHRRRAGGRSCCASRPGAPRPRSARSTRPMLGPTASSRRSGAAEPGRVAIDLADGRRPAGRAPPRPMALLALETRDGGPASLGVGARVDPGLLADRPALPSDRASG